MTPPPRSKWMRSVAFVARRFWLACTTSAPPEGKKGPGPLSTGPQVPCKYLKILGKLVGTRGFEPPTPTRSEEHTSELQSLMRISYAVFCLKKKNNIKNNKSRIHKNL